ncbi:MAG: 5'/3'-nucleotidase SurE [Chlamydiota bacterium]
MQQLRILLVNDDGIGASGLRSLYRAMRPHASLTVVAPSTQKSGSGLGTTLIQPLQIREQRYFDGTTAYSVNGTPSDCVKLALIHLFAHSPPDLILSGINHGSNAGKTVLYSGTIGAVIEGMFRNQIPGIAFSSCEEDLLDYSCLEPYILPIVSYNLQHPPPKDSFLNVNFPSQSAFPIRGMQLTKQGKGFWTDTHEKSACPKGAHSYQLTGEWKKEEEETGSDVHALENGYISVAPIHVGDLTDHYHYNSHQELFATHFKSFLVGQANPTSERTPYKALLFP